MRILNALILMKNIKNQQQEAERLIQESKEQNQRIKDQIKQSQNKVDQSKEVIKIPEQLTRKSL